MSKPLPNPEFDAAPVILTKTERAAMTKADKKRIIHYEGRTFPATVPLGRGKSITFATFAEWWKLRGILHRESRCEAILEGRG